MTPDPESARVSDASSAGEAVGGGRYVVVGSLGAGSQGETLSAVDKREGRPVAIKRFTIRGAKSWKDVELAEREATVLASLSHSGLPRYIDHFEENGALYLVMEKIEGETLQTRRRRGAGLDQAQVTRFLRDAGACLRYLHSQAPPVVHRDIKPGNVILRPDGSYCLVDFGSVRDRLKPEGGSTVVGTFGFMAPEQFQGRAGPSSDVYAVGATALSLLTGREPEDLPHKGLSVDVEKALRGQVERRLIGALRSMLEPDPDKRARSVEDALRAAGLTEGSGAPPSARPATERRERDAAREERYTAREQRHAEREQRRERKYDAYAEERVRRKVERQARRVERRYLHDWHPPGRPVPPGMAIGAFILLALRVAGVATFALFGVLLPLLFTLLNNRRARQRMLQIGDTGQAGLARASEHIRYRLMGGPVPPELESFLREHGVDVSARDRRDARPAASRRRVAVDTDGEGVDDERAHDAEAGEPLPQTRGSGKADQ